MMNGLESPKNYSDSPDERRKYKRVSPSCDIEATIDGATKRFNLKEVSSLLEKATEI